jgi:PKD repeat protein
VIISSNAQAIDIYHNGGDSFNFENTHILVDGVDVTPSVKLNGASGWSTWNVGQSLTYDLPPGSPVPSSIQIVYTTGGAPLLIAQSGQGTTTALSVNPAIVTGITPNSGTSGTVVSVTNLAGSGFLNGASVTLHRAGSTVIIASNVMVVSSTNITCDFDLTGAPAGGGAWDVIVTNPSGPSGTLSSAFSIVAAFPPVVDFSGTPLTGTVPLTVSFTDLSTNGVESWLWTFGDSNFSYAQNPSNTYVTTGNYSVKLTATNSAGSGNLTKTNYIWVKPIVTYTINATVAGSGGSISPSGDVSVIQGNTQNFTITPTTGYHISDVLVDSVSNGAITDYSFPNVAANHTITAAFAINQYAINATSGAGGNVTPAGITLVNYGSNQSYNITPSTGYHISDVLVNNASVGTGTTYEFTNVMANQTISATFAINTYTITPSVAGGHGTVSPSTVQTVNYGATPTFNFTPDINYHLYNITVNGSGVAFTGNNYTFPAVTTDKILVGTFIIDPPVANFTGTPRTGAVPFTVTYNDTSTNSPTSWLWNFGDGNFSTLQHPVYTYPLSGNYSVQLTATNEGGSNTSLKVGYTFAYTPAVANFTATPTIGSIPLSVQFTDTSTGSPTGWNWSFGDFSVSNYSSAQDPGYTYSTAGLYSVNLSVANAYSSSYLLRTNYINVTAAAPTIVLINANKTLGDAPLPVYFKGGANNVPTSWLWEFNDGTADVTTQNVNHTFINPGIFNVSLTASNAGGSATAYKLINVTRNYTITASAGTGGTISPSGTTVVSYGATPTYTITPATNFHVADVLVNGTSVGAVTTYVFPAVTTNKTINASFAGDVPTFVSMTPVKGPNSTTVITPITITGTNLIGATTSGIYNVTIGGKIMTNMTVVSDTTIIGSTPAYVGVGPVDVVITTPNGTVTAADAYRYYFIHKFTTIGTFSSVAPTGATLADYLVVAGGGGGGRYGGGGGAGGMLHGTAAVTAGTSYRVIVGGGGAGSSSAARGVSGSNSTFGGSTAGDGINADGGGGGGSSSATAGSGNRNGAAGASGGGGSRSGTTGGLNITSQGFAGGAGAATSNFLGGGGGGAGSHGIPATASVAGKGGNGASDASDLLILANAGVDVGGTHYIAGGGGGGCQTSWTAGAGGVGGGGAGGDNAAGTAGTANTGGGGGGSGSSGNGGAGGSGIVILMYY